MSYTAITSIEIVTGNPTTNSTWTKVKDNLIDHETRIQTVESGGAVTYPPIIMRVNGNYGSYGILTGILKTVTNFALTITGVRIYIDEAGSAGTTEIDIKVSSSGGAYTSIFTTKPSVGYASGNDALSSNAVLDSAEVALSSGDIIRLDLTSVQTDGTSFMVRIDYNKT